MTIRAGKVFNRSIHIIIIVFSVISIAIYLSIRFSITQHYISHNISHKLSELLKTEVKIEDVEITPFNQIAFNGILLKDRGGDTLLHVRRAMMGIELFALLKGDIQISTIQLIGCHINIYKPNYGEPTNAQFVIDALAPRQNDRKRKFIENLHINSIGIRQGYLSYHVQNTPLIKNRLDVNHIVCQEISANIRNFEISNHNTLNLDLRRLKIEEASGIVLKQGMCHLQIDNSETRLENLDILLNNSRLQAERLELDNHPIQTLRQENNEHSCIQTQALQLLISPEDFNLYFGHHNHIKQPIRICMDITGSNQKISIPNLDMTFTDNLHINAGLTLYRPYRIFNGSYTLNPNENLWLANIRSCQASPSAVNLLLSGILPEQNSSKIAPIINRLGEITFVGDCEGSYKTMHTFGKINTRQAGNIYLESSIDHYTSLIPGLPNHGEETALYVGNIKTHQLHIGQISGHPNAGTLDANLDVHISLHPRYTPQASIRGDVSTFYWAGHPYTEVTLNTNLKRDRYDGEIKIKDIDGEIAISGFAHLTDTLSVFKLFADIQHFHPHRLNLTENKYMKDIGLSARVESHIQFNKWDDLNGSLSIENILMTSPLDTMRLRDINLVSFSGVDTSDIQISSPIISINYKGNAKISSMFTDAQNIVRQHFSENGKCTEQKTKNINNATSGIVQNQMGATQNDRRYEFSGTFFESKYISEFLGLPLSIHRDITFDGNIKTAIDQLHAEISIPHINYCDYSIRSLCGIIENRRDSSANNSTESYLYFAGDGVCTRNNTTWEGHLSGECRQNKLISLMTFDHIAPKSSVKSVIDIYSNFETTLNNLPDSITIMPRMLEINGHPWQSSPILIHQEKPQLWAFSGAITNTSPHSHQPNKLTNTYPESKTIPSLIKSLRANGYINTQSQPKVEIEMQNFELADIFSFIDSKYTNFGGSTTGKILLDLQDSIPHISGHNLSIENFAYQNSTIGNARYNMHWDLNRHRMSLKCDVSEKSEISGEIYLNPKGIKDSLSLTFDTEDLPVDFLSFWIGGVLRDFKARSSGTIRLFGTTDRLYLEGDPTLRDVSFSNDFLGATFFFDAPISLSSHKPIPTNSNSSGKIKLDHITLRDAMGETCTLTAEINHRHLSDIIYRIDIDIPEKKNTGFLIYDHPYKPDNNTFWGQLYVHGACRLNGDSDNHNINVSARVAGNSKFYLSPGENTLSEGSYNFLTFRNKTHQSLLQHEHHINGNNTSSPQQFPLTTDHSTKTNISADLILEMTPECRINVIMDPLADDRLTCQGYGNLNVKYDTRTPITLLGVYNMTGGKYTVTMPGDMMSKDFNIESGSSITFSGGTDDANLNIHAAYSIPSVNLTDLDESFATLSSLSRTTVPVDCKLLVSGELQAPQIAFDVEVKRVSTDVQAMVRNIIGTSDMMSRQAFYLLLFGRFYTPDYATAASTHSGSEIASFASATLTSQLNHLLGQMSDYVSIGTHFRSDRGDFSDMEMDLALSTRLLNNRLLLNGNFGYRDRNNNIGTNNTTNFIGDFDVEYLINPTGTFRLKAYSHYNERDYGINNAQTTQGVGFVFRRDYESLRELLKKRRASKQHEGSR